MKLTILALFCAAFLAQPVIALAAQPEAELSPYPAEASEPVVIGPSVDVIPRSPTVNVPASGLELGPSWARAPIGFYVLYGTQVLVLGLILLLMRVQSMTVYHRSPMAAGPGYGADLRQLLQEMQQLTIAVGLLAARIERLEAVQKGSAPGDAASPRTSSHERQIREEPAREMLVPDAIYPTIEVTREERIPHEFAGLLRDFQRAVEKKDEDPQLFLRLHRVRGYKPAASMSPEFVPIPDPDEAEIWAVQMQGHWLLFPGAEILKGWITYRPAAALRDRLEGAYDVKTGGAQLTIVQPALAREDAGRLVVEQRGVLAGAR